MQRIIDIHTHGVAPRPQAVISVSPEGAVLAAGQDYSAGIHPWDSLAAPAEETWRLLDALCAETCVRAVGECGIDLVKGGPLFMQMQIFKRQAELSERLRKPLIIHCVKAHDIIIGMKKEIAPRQNWLVHGFRGKPSVARMLLDAGIWLSFGPLHNCETVRMTPHDRMLAETDASGIPIGEVIASLSALTGGDMSETIAINSEKFLESR